MSLSYRTVSPKNIFHIKDYNYQIVLDYCENIQFNDLLEYEDKIFRVLDIHKTLNELIVFTIVEYFKL